MKQRELALLERGRGRRDAALGRVTRRSNEWMFSAMAALERYIVLRPADITMERFRDWWFAHGGEPPSHHNAWGALANVAVRRRLLHITHWAPAVTPRSHARRMPVYARGQE